MMIKVIVWPALRLWRIIAVYVLMRLLAMITISPLEGWTFFDGFWWSGVASLTIGYGDIFPKTLAGKVLADMFQMTWVLYCAPVIVGHMVKLLFKNMNELTHLEQEWLFMTVTRCYSLLRAIFKIVVATAVHQGVVVTLPSFARADGSVPDLPPQPSDLDNGEELRDDFDGDHDADGFM